MATVTGVTADRMLAIEGASVVDARREDDRVILITKSGLGIDLGDFKGEPGNTGAVGIHSISTSYTDSASGTVPPDDEFFTDIIPDVSPGLYLWTRIVFRTIDDVDTVGYTVARMGENGRVNSVNGNTDPDIVLEASDIGAVSNTDPNYRIWPGTVWDFAGDVIPPTWVECDGSYYEISEHPDLYEAIGTFWGSTTETNFRVPPLSGCATVGVDPTDPNLNAVGKIFGSKTHLLTAGQIPQLSAESSGEHSHTITVNSGGAHSHSITVNSGGAHGHGIGGLGRIMTTNRSGTFAQKKDPGVATSTTVVPAYGDHTDISSETTVSSGGAHAHTASSNSTGAHTHTASSNSTGAHTHVVNSGAATPFSLMSPSAVMRKIIKL